ncbi:MAG: hypothetical protein RR290_03195 [Clostridia bacterium]
MKNKKIKGSAILIVILSAVVFSIYTSSTYAQQEHFSIMQKKYEETIKKYYEKDNENIEEIYIELYNINKVNKNNI